MIRTIPYIEQVGAKAIRIYAKLTEWMMLCIGLVIFLCPVLSLAQGTTCPTITNTSQTSVAVCSGYIVDSLQVKTTAFYPTGIELVRFDSPQTDPYSAAGISLGDLIPSNTIATMRTISFPDNTEPTDKTYYVYARLKPVPTDVSCRPSALLTVTIRSTPTATIVGQEATCQGTVSLNDGGVRIANFKPTDSYEVANNGLFSGFGRPIPSDGLVVRNITRSGQVAMYSVRVYNSYKCYVAQTVTLTNQPCNCPPSKCVPFVVKRVAKK